MSDGKRISPADLAALRAALLRSRQELLGAVSRDIHDQIDRDSQALPDVHEQSADTVTAMEERDLARSLGEHHSAALGEVHAALQRMDEDRYGVCEQCGAPIPAARLKASPTATRCVSCQGQAERGIRIPGL